MSLQDMFNDNAREMTALEHAVRSGHREIVDILLRQGADVNKSRPSAADQSRQPFPTPAKSVQGKKPIKIMKPITLKTGRRR